jgi:hypothetical protein
MSLSFGDFDIAYRALTGHDGACRWQYRLYCDIESGRFPTDVELATTPEGFESAPRAVQACRKPSCRVLRIRPAISRTSSAPGELRPGASGPDGKCDSGRLSCTADGLIRDQATAHENAAAFQVLSPSVRLDYLSAKPFVGFHGSLRNR